MAIIRTNVMFSSLKQKVNWTLIKYQSLKVLVEACALCNFSHRPVSYQRSNAGHVGVLYGLLFTRVGSVYRRYFSFFLLASSRGQWNLIACVTYVFGSIEKRQLTVCFVCGYSLKNQLLRKLKKWAVGLSHDCYSFCTSHSLNMNLTNQMMD